MKKTILVAGLATATILTTTGFMKPSVVETVKPVAIVKQDPGQQVVYKSSTKGFPKNITRSEKQCLVENLYHEARGESIKGQSAVVYVVLNRALSETRKYGETSNMCDIIKAPKAFSWTIGSVKAVTDREAWDEASAVVDKVLRTYSLKNSPVADATHYVNKKIATAKAKWWKSKKMTVLAAVGSHTFFKQKNEVIAIKRA